MNKKNVISPCISICRSDPLTDFCYGCGRTSEDKKFWKNPETTNEWKISNLELTKSRLNGWHKKSWEKSYAYKKENGISLMQEKLLKQKK